VTKVLTASKAGNPPDLFQAEYQALPTLVSNNAAADLKKYVGSTKSAFADGVWQQVTLGTDSVYGIPQDAGPMMLYYRADIFTQLGLQVPTTWDQFAQLAQQVRVKDPKRYLTTFSTGDPGWFAGLAQQAGASWWSVSGTTWKVTIDDAATKKVADYWGNLVNTGVIDCARLRHRDLGNIRAAAAVVERHRMPAWILHGLQHASVVIRVHGCKRTAGVQPIRPSGQVATRAGNINVLGEPGGGY